MSTIGKFIVLYGINNLGKTLQAKLLVEFLEQQKGLEKNHEHENDDKRVSKTRENFCYLANQNGWPIVDANQSIEDVSVEVQQIISLKKLFSNTKKRRQSHANTTS